MMRLVYMISAYVLVTAGKVLAFGGEEAVVEGFFNRTTTFLTSVVGGGVFTIGVIVTGLKMAGHKQDALQTGIMVMGGGALIFLAPTILGLIQSFTGAR